jgi:hypothetical protein
MPNKDSIFKPANIFIVLAVFLGCVFGFALSRIYFLRTGSFSVSNNFNPSDNSDALSLASSQGASQKTTTETELSLEMRLEATVMTALVDVLEGATERLSRASSSSSSTSKQSSSKKRKRTSPKKDPTQAFSQETCYLQSDESEICVYDNAICFDGFGPVILVADPYEGSRAVQDGTHNCLDNRFGEVSVNEWGSCVKQVLTRRERSYRANEVLGAGEAQGLDGRSLSTESSYPLLRRRFGPHTRGPSMIFREFSAKNILNEGNNSTREVQLDEHTFLEEASLLLSKIDESTKDERYSHSLIPGLKMLKKHVTSMYTWPEIEINQLNRMLSWRRIIDAESKGLPVPQEEDNGNRNIISGPITVEWIEGAMWMVGMDNHWWLDPMHFLTKASLLFDAQRNNATCPVDDLFCGTTFSGNLGHPQDGWKLRQEEVDISLKPSFSKSDSPLGTSTERTRSLYRQGGQWQLPPMDLVILSMSDGKVSDVQMDDWYTNVLKIVTQKQSTIKITSPLDPTFSHDHLICARQGVVVGTKPQLFTGRSDAIVFRNAAYKLAGVEMEGGHGDTGVYPLYPPRQITLVHTRSRKSNVIYNIDEVLSALKDTGLPVNVITVVRGAPFSDIVKDMSRTGILVAPSDTDLAMIAFLPVHSVVIELFQYGKKQKTFQDVSSVLNLFYHPLRSTHRPPKKVSSELYDRQFFDECFSRNSSSFDNNVLNYCRDYLKNAPIVVDVSRLKDTLNDALDEISAFSRENDQWDFLFKKNKLSGPKFEDYEKGA